MSQTGPSDQTLNFTPFDPRTGASNYETGARTSWLGHLELRVQLVSDAGRLAELHRTAAVTLGRPASSAAVD